jgi:hypothetical protein
MTVRCNCLLGGWHTAGLMTKHIDELFDWPWIVANEYKVLVSVRATVEDAEDELPLARRIETGDEARDGPNVFARRRVHLTDRQIEIEAKVPVREVAFSEVWRPRKVRTDEARGDGPRASDEEFVACSLNLSEHTL